MVNQLSVPLHYLSIHPGQNNDQLNYICIVVVVERAWTESEEMATFTYENGLFLTLGSGTSGAWNENLSPLFNRNIPLISGKYDLRNHFWQLESRFSHEEKWEKGPNFWGP